MERSNCYEDIVLLFDVLLSLYNALLSLWEVISSLCVVLLQYDVLISLCEEHFLLCRVHLSLWQMRLLWNDHSSLCGMQVHVKIIRHLRTKSDTFALNQILNKFQLNLKKMGAGKTDINQNIQRARMIFVQSQYIWNVFIFFHFGVISRIVAEHHILCFNHLHCPPYLNLISLHNTIVHPFKLNQTRQERPWWS